MSLLLLLTTLALAQEAPAEPEPPADTETPAEPESPAEPETPADTETPADAETPADTEIPAEPAPAPEPTPTADEEIIVYGELALAKARDAVVRDMERLGWRSKEKADGTIVFRGPKGWMGSARFDPELASLDFRRSAVGFRLATYDEPAYTQPTLPADPSGVANDAAVPSGAGFWLFPRKDKVDGHWRQVREATQAEIDAYQKVLYATAFEERLQGIAAKLDALWTAGVPIDGSGSPVPEDQRLQAVVDFWATRADTKEGLRMTKAVEAWITNALDAVPDDVQRAAEARRQDERSFPAVGG